MGAQKKRITPPYHGTLLNTPFFHMLLEPVLPVLKPALAGIYAFRWQLSRPLQIRALPKRFPVLNLPGLKYLPFLTIGQILLALPLVFFIVLSYQATFVARDAAGSGTYASYAIFATFLTASKTNSIVTLIFGIPFERLVPYHNLSALTAVLLTCFHLTCAYGLTDGSDSAYYLSGSDPNFLKFLFDGTTVNRSGTLMALSVLAMVVSSLFPILRRKFFDAWFWTHMALAVCVILFAI